MVIAPASVVCREKCGVGRMITLLLKTLVVGKNVGRCFVREYRRSVQLFNPSLYPERLKVKMFRN